MGRLPTCRCDRQETQGVTADLWTNFVVSRVTDRVGTRHDAQTVGMKMGRNKTGSGQMKIHIVCSELHPHRAIALDF
jgi:hypothetical protein